MIRDLRIRIKAGNEHDSIKSTVAQIAAAQRENLVTSSNESPDVIPDPTSIASDEAQEGMVAHQHG
jgi:hypothetical protein